MAPQEKGIILTARHVLPVTAPEIKDGAVYVEQGIIRDVDKLGRIARRYNAEVRELGKGILMPGFINAHVHLELGPLQAQLDPKDDFPAWILEIIKKRLTLSKKKAVAGVQKGIDTLVQSGVAGIGEISTLGIDRQPLLRSPLYTVLFKEVISAHKLDGAGFARESMIEERPFPHAVYSTAPDAYVQTSKRFEAYGTHLAESIDEYRFITGAENNFIKRLSPLIRRKDAMDGCRSPVEYINKLGFFDRKATLVHCVHIDRQDLDIIASHHAGIVLCPRSNAYLGVGLPDITLLGDYPRLGLGTDGLSSNYSLDMMDELRFLYLIARPVLKSRAGAFVINAATIGGARSLFIEDKLGSIQAGRYAGLIYLDTDVAKNLYLSIINTPSSGITNLSAQVHMAGEAHG
jgi:cytosine/adenosine deaminase-related metal-dependent hydrolase